MDSDEILKTKLQKALSECQRLREENAQLRLRVHQPNSEVSTPPKPLSAIANNLSAPSSSLSNDSRPEAKVSLFRSLFRGKDDVYAVRWEGRSGTTGYAPAGLREWEQPSSTHSGKKQSFHYSKLFPLSDEAIRDHLLGKQFIDRLIRLAAFQNPEFYKTQAMRLSTFGKPRVIACAEDLTRYIALPRGLLEEAINLFRTQSIEVNIIDHRFSGVPLEVDFHGDRRAGQADAAKALASCDEGILCAPTAFGKTAVAAQLIALRKVNTLVLVHRRHLMDQWRERLATFLGLSFKDIGQIGGGKTKQTKHLDVAVMQSLIRKGEVRDLVSDYGQVIVDECHHVSAFSFERVLKKVKAKYVAGLTATPIRKDGHHPIILMQCGPIRFNASNKSSQQLRQFDTK